MKVCFVISPIGSEGSDVRARADQVLRHVIEPAAEYFDYRVIRAETISTPGMITSQVIQHILESHLVIADLTDHNPNVFYELAVRHVVRKPLVQLIDKSQSLPFDVSGARTIFFDLTLDGAADAVEQIKKQIAALEKNPSDLDTPISITSDLISLARMSTQDQGNTTQLLPVLTDIGAAVHNYGREIRALRTDLERIELQQRLTGQVETRNPVTGRRAGISRFDLALRRIRHADPIIYEYGMDLRRQIVVGNIQNINEMLSEFRAMIEGNADIPPDDKDTIMTGFDRLITTHRDSRQNDDLPF